MNLPCPSNLFALWTADAQGPGLQLQATQPGVLPPPGEQGLARWLQRAQAGGDKALPAAVAAAMEAGRPFQVEVLLRCPDGATRCLMVAGLPLVGTGNSAQGRYHGFMLDVGAQRNAFEAALRTAAQDRLLVEHSTDLIAHCDQRGRYVSISPSYSRLIGWTDEEVVGRLVTELLHPDDRAAAEQALAHLFGGGVLPDAVEVRKRHRDGHYVTVGTKACAVTNDHGHCIGAVLVSRDITRDKARLKDLETLATRDLLTGLPNRAWIEEHIAHRLAQGDGQARTAVFFIDLNGFKAVNDSQGHAAGDVLLQQVGQRLQGGLRPGDAVARLGGDEFVVAAACGDATAAAGIAQRLLDSLQAPFCTPGGAVPIGAAIGISLSLAATDTTALLFERADLAMYQAKACGGSAFRFFEPGQQR